MAESLRLLAPLRIAASRIAGSWIIQVKLQTCFVARSLDYWLLRSRSPWLRSSWSGEWPGAGSAAIGVREPSPRSPFPRTAVADRAARQVEVRVGPAEDAEPPPKQILFGDLHVHTTYSSDAFLFSLPILQGEGAHPPADACDFARYCSGLDFWSINDHAELLTPRQWAETRESIRLCNEVAGDPENPDLVSFLGWEWTQMAATAREPLRPQERHPPRHRRRGSARSADRRRAQQPRRGRQGDAAHRPSPDAPFRVFRSPVPTWTSTATGPRCSRYRTAREGSTSTSYRTTASRPPRRRACSSRSWGSGASGPW